MKKIIRKRTFETNSSSTHSLTFMTRDQFEKWKNEELYKDPNSDELYTKEENKQMIKEVAEEHGITEEEVMENYREYDLPVSYEEWCDDEFLETDSYSYTTEHGDEIIAVCKYGYDG